LLRDVSFARHDGKIGSSPVPCQRRHFVLQIRPKEPEIRRGVPAKAPNFTSC
jgi:hypothetical protein